MAFSMTIFGFPLISIGFGFVALGAISSSIFLYRWKSKSSTLIASLYYGILFSHKGIRHIIHDAFSNVGVKKDRTIMLLLSFVSCLIIAHILFLVIEKPFMKMRKQFL